MRTAGEERKYLKRMLPLLQTIKDFKPKQRRSILLNHLDDEACETIYEAVANVLKNERVDPKTRLRLKKKLAAHKNDLRYLASPSKKPALKKKKLAKMGGFPLTAILSAAIPLLLSHILPSLTKRG